MLTKVLLQQKRSQFNLLKQTQRSVALMADKGYHVPQGEGIDDMINHLDKVRPTYALIHFVASWNPACSQI